jgi:arylformamidase
MRIIDISWPISPEMTSYKNKKTVQFLPVKEFEKDNARETIITLNCHTGTHVDAPSHFTAKGKTIDEVSLACLIGHCVVIDCTDTHVLSKDYLESKALSINHTRVLFKTRNSFLDANEPFNSEFVFLDASGAQWCKQQGIKTVGIDYLGIERGQPNHDTHSSLFADNITIIEGLRLADVEQGEYQLVCLPLNIVGLEAAPARAVLIEKQLY